MALAEGALFFIPSTLIKVYKRNVLRERGREHLILPACVSLCRHSLDLGAECLALLRARALGNTRSARKCLDRMVKNTN